MKSNSINKIFDYNRVLNYISRKRVEKILKDEFHFNKIGEFGEKDVTIVGYPKSGNTWFQNIISALYFGVDLEYCNYNLISSLSIDVHVERYFRRYGDIAFFKSHDLPSPQLKKVILLMRDGRDVMVSYYHHLRRYADPNLTFKDMLNDKNGVLWYGKWHIHANAWLENPYNAEVLLLKYEDMLLDPLEGVNKICAFIGIERSDELKNKVIAQSSFQQMQKRETEQGWGNYEFKTFSDGRFVRKGGHGNYKMEFPSDLLSDYEREIENLMKKIGYPI